MINFIKKIWWWLHRYDKVFVYNKKGLGILYKKQKSRNWYSYAEYKQPK